MEPKFDHVVSDRSESGFVLSPDAAPDGDVPSRLAERIGNLYAAEESRQRHERSQRNIRRAEESH